MQRPERRRDLDWLRVLAILLLLFYHVGRLFDHEPWHIKAEVRSDAIAVVGYFPVSASRGP